MFQKEEQAIKQEQKPTQNVKQDAKIGKTEQQKTEKPAPKKSRKQKA